MIIIYGQETLLIYCVLSTFQWFHFPLDLNPTRQQALDTKIDNLTREAIAKGKANNKRGALQALRSKKEYEKQRQQRTICYDSIAFIPYFTDHFIIVHFFDLSVSF